MKRIILTITVVFLMFGTMFATFDNEGGTVRSKSMGDAIFGDFDGVNTVNYNPATISMNRAVEFYGAWDTPYAALNDGSSINTVNAMFIIPFWNKFSLRFDRFFTRRGALALGMQRKSVSGEDTEIYHEGIYSFTYAKDLNDVISRGAKISFGVRISIYDMGVGQDVADVAANAANFTSFVRTSFGLDLGLTYDFSESIRLGLAYKNLVSPNISIMPDGEDRLPSEFRLGANWEIGKLLFMKKAKLGFGFVTYGREASDNRQADMSYHLGFEFRQLSADKILKSKPFKGEMLAIRFGAVYQAKKIVEDVINLSAGIGFSYVFGRKHKINIDYAFEYGINMGAIKHSAGLTYAILLPNSAFAYKEEIKKEMEFEELIKEKSDDKKDGDNKALEKEKEKKEGAKVDDVDVELNAIFPAKYSKYNDALAKVRKISSSLEGAADNVDKFGANISRLIGDGKDFANKPKDALKAYTKYLKSRGAVIGVNVRVKGDAVKFKVKIIKPKKVSDELQKNINDFEEVITALSAAADDLKSSITTCGALAKQCKKLAKSAKRDFKGKDASYAPKAAKSLADAAKELGKTSAKAKSLIKSIKNLAKIIKSEFGS